MRTRVFGLMMWLALIAAAAPAQTVSLLNVKVTDLRPVYELGKSIMLTPVSRPPDSLHVRVFFGSIEQLKKTRPDKDRCIPFYTTILWGIGHPNLINLDALTNQNIVNRGTTTVTLVFEAGSHPEPGAFRLKPESINAYFKNAIEIHVAPASDQQEKNREVTEAFLESMRQPHSPVTTAPATSPVSTPPCFNVDEQPRNSTADNDGSAGVTLVATVAPMVCTDQPGALTENSHPTGPAGF